MRKRSYSINTFCAAFDVGRTKTYQEIAAGRLKAHKSGRRTVIFEEDAEAWRDALPELKPRQHLL